MKEDMYITLNLQYKVKNDNKVHSCVHLLKLFSSDPNMGDLLHCNFYVKKHFSIRMIEERLTLLFFVSLLYGELYWLTYEHLDH